jgi:hypothetical protein
MIKKGNLIESALRSYNRSIKKLKECSPDWKPISFEEYTEIYCKKLPNKRIQV